MHTEKDFDLYVKANPECLADIRQQSFQAGHAEGLAEARTEALDRLSALQRKYSAYPQFILEQFAQGHTVESAAPAFVDLLEAENHRLRAEAEDRMPETGRGGRAIVRQWVA